MPHDAPPKASETTIRIRKCRMTIEKVYSLDPSHSISVGYARSYESQPSRPETPKLPLPIQDLRYNPRLTEEFYITRKHSDLHIILIISRLFHPSALPYLALLNCRSKISSHRFLARCSWEWICDMLDVISVECSEYLHMLHEKLGTKNITV